MLAACMHDQAGAFECLYIDARGPETAARLRLACALLANLAVCLQAQLAVRLQAMGAGRMPCGTSAPTSPVAARVLLS